MKPFLLLVCPLLTACSVEEASQRLGSPEDRSIARLAITAIQAGDIRRMPAMHPELAKRLPALMPRMAPIVPRGADTHYNLVGADTEHDLTTGARTSRLAYEVAGDGRHAYVSIGIRRGDGEPRLVAVQALPLPGPLAELNRFTLAGKSALHFAFLLAAAGSFATIAVALFLLIRTPGVRRKWLWGVGACLGVGQIAIDWTTGQVHLNPIFLQLFGAMFVKAGVGMPWLVGFGLPVVALVILFRRPLWIAEAGRSAGQQ